MADRFVFPVNERRFHSTNEKGFELEIRDVAESEGQIVFEGYFAKFDLEYREEALGYAEIIKPGFFREAIKKNNTPALLNHNTTFMFARQTANSKNGLLELFEDEIGLRYRAYPLQTQTIKDLVVEPVRAGLLRGCSFGFSINRGKETEDDGHSLSYNRKTGIVTRALLPGGCRNLRDGSFVVDPAYEFEGIGMNVRSKYMAVDMEYEDFLMQEMKRIIGS